LHNILSKNQQTKMEISNSKNVLLNVTMGNVGGNFHVGDVLHLHFADGSIQNFPLNEIKDRLHQALWQEVLEKSKSKDFFERIAEAMRKPQRFLTTPPFQAPIFIGRDTELQTVHDRLFGGENFLMLVNGQGGIGKTTFASKYWDKYQHEYSHLAFLYVENGIANAILRLAPELGLKFENEPLTEQLETLIKAVTNLEKPCLLILDNANDAEDLENNFQILRKCENFHILLTSRIRKAYTLQRILPQTQDNRKRPFLEFLSFDRRQYACDGDCGEKLGRNQSGGSLLFLARLFEGLGK
jgi:NB-ARC domain